MISITEKWDKRYLELAKHVASWSKDVSTKVGSVIVGTRNQVRSLGFNGLPIGVADTPERLNNREIKYSMTLHAERNSIIFANGGLEDCTMYTFPFQPCSVCSGMIIQSGITRCVSPPLPDHLKDRWGKDTQLARRMLLEAKVRMDFVSI